MHPGTLCILKENPLWLSLEAVLYKAQTFNKKTVEFSQSSG